MVVFVSNKALNAALKKIERANCDAHGLSIAAVSMYFSDLLLEVQDDKNGCLMVDDWREGIKARYLVPTKSPQEALQDALLEAISRQKKTRREYGVVRLTNRHGSIRYRVYPDGQTHKALNDAQIGEAIKYLGKTNRHGSPNHPLPFWCESHFKEEYDALPIVQQHEIDVWGMPYNQWIEQKLQQEKHRAIMQSQSWKLLNELISWG